jgi:hypothetical protein
VCYAVDKRYSSELLTYTLDFLEELLRRKVPGVADNLYRQYPEVFEKLDISPAPLLIRIDGLSTFDLLAEDGSDAGANIQEARKIVREFPESFEELLQQTNFRLRCSVPAARLQMWLINVARWKPFSSEYTLHQVSGRWDEAPQARCDTS